MYFRSFLSTENLLEQTVRTGVCAGSCIQTALNSPLMPFWPLHWSHDGHCWQGLYTIVWGSLSMWKILTYAQLSLQMDCLWPNYNPPWPSVPGWTAGSMTLSWGFYSDCWMLSMSIWLCICLCLETFMPQNSIFVRRWVWVLIYVVWILFRSDRHVSFITIGKTTGFLCRG